METKTKEKKKFDLSNYGKAVCFILLEILAVLSFSLGSSFIFMAILAFVVLVFIILVTIRQIKTDGLATVGFFLFPILIFSLLSVLSYFRYDEYFIMYQSPFLFLIPIGLICFAASGYLINLTGSFKIRHALVVIYSGIALLTFINLLVTMVQFVPFYSLIYRDAYYYYDGARSSTSVGNMAYFLINFSMVEVSLSYFSYYPIILLTAFVPLGFIKFKENKKLFITYLCFGILGLISLIFTINKITLLMTFGVALLIGIISLYTKFNLNTKPLKIASIVVGAFGVLGIFLLFLNAQDSVGYSMRVAGLRNLTTGSTFLNRLFNANRFSSAYDSILDGVFASRVIDGRSVLLKLFGYPINGGYVDYFGAMTWKITDSNSFFFDTFFTSGFFGVLFLVVILVLGIRRVLLYYKYSQDHKADKVMVLSFVIISLAYAFFAHDATPFIFNKTIIPFYMNNIFMIDLFLFGYCLFNSEKPKQEAQSVEEVKEVVVNEE